MMLDGESGFCLPLFPFFSILFEKENAERRHLAMKPTLFIISALFAAAFLPMEAASFETDTFQTSSGPLKITFVGHGTLYFEFGGKVIHVDPVGQYADYSKLPKADLILVTHEHGDHMDLKAIEAIRTGKTKIVYPEVCAASIQGGIVMKNGDAQTVEGLRVEAVPAYNLVHMRSEGAPYHPKGRGNGYIVTFGDKRVYIGGDTENTPEMKALKNIDIAFLPMNLPYTMTPEMVADAAKAFLPKVLYPYHYADTDVSKLQALMKDVKGVEVRIRALK
jgi:L-ascorbate metabolism protein UlaG (beta-lactamase superfamily)